MSVPENVLDAIMAVDEDHVLNVLKASSIITNSEAEAMAPEIEEIANTFISVLSDMGVKDDKLASFMNRLSKDVFVPIMSHNTIESFTDVAEYSPTLIIADTATITPLEQHDDLKATSLITFKYPNAGLPVDMKESAYLYADYLHPETIPLGIIQNAIDDKGKKRFSSFFEFMLGVSTTPIISQTVSPLAFLAYGILLGNNRKYFSVIRDATTSTYAEGVLLGAEHRLKDISSAIALAFMKKGLLLPFDVLKMRNEGTKDGYDYQYNSLTLRFYSPGWSFYETLHTQDSESNPVKKIQKEILAVFNISLGLETMLLQTAHDLENTGDPTPLIKLAKIARENRRKLLVSDDMSVMNSALAVFEGEETLGEFIKRVMEAKHPMDLEGEIRGMVVTPIEPLKKIPTPEPTRPEPPIRPEPPTVPSEQIRAIIGETKGYIEELARGIQKYGSEHTYAMNKIINELVAYSEDPKMFRAYLKLMNNNKFKEEDAPARFGVVTKRLGYTGIPLADVEKRVGFIRSILKDPNVLRVEKRETDGAIIVTRKDGVVIHYDGDKERRRYSNEYRFENGVHTLASESSK